MKLTKSKWRGERDALHEDIVLKMKLVGYSLREERRSRYKTWVLYDDEAGLPVRNKYDELCPYPICFGSMDRRWDTTVHGTFQYVLRMHEDQRAFLLSGDAMNYMANLNGVEMTYREMFTRIVPITNR